MYDDQMKHPHKEITITVAGSCGSGKTGTVVAIANLLKEKGATVTVDDQDGDLAVRLAMEDNRIDAIAPHLTVTIKTVWASK